MERSRNRTPIIQRSKGACIAGLVVTLGCAMFGVGGAAAGDGHYARHLRMERQLGRALAHRSPEQLVLAMTPKLHPAPAPAHAPVPAATQVPAAPVTPAPTTTQSASTPKPAAPAKSTRTGTSATPTGATTNLTAGITSPTAPASVPAVPPTSTTSTTSTTTTTTPTTTSTTPTTTSTSTTPTTATTDPSTTTTDPSTSSQGDAIPVNGRPQEAGASTPGSSANVCHGRGCTSTTPGGVVPAGIPAAASPAATGSYSLTNSSGSLAGTPAVTQTPAQTPINAVSNVGSTIPTGPTAPTGGNKNTTSALSGIPTLAGALGGLHLRTGKSSKRSGTGAPIATAGTGAVSAGPVSTGPTGTAGGTTTAAAHAGTAARHAGSTTSHKTPKHASSGGSALPSQVTRVFTQVVSVIPTTVWMALGAAFALALAFAGIALRSSRRARRREREFVAISAAAATDALTGILNRRGFMDAAERELARASRYDRPFVLAYVDVRGLKAVNDTEGHLVGDELIQTVAGLMKESARADDVVGRIGGDEFALLLDEQTAESAEPVIRRIRTRVEERRAAMEIRVPWELTIGLAAFPADGTTLEELLGTADRRLYEQRGIALR